MKRLHFTTQQIETRCGLIRSGAGPESSDEIQPSAAAAGQKSLAFGGPEHRKGGQWNPYFTRKPAKHSRVLRRCDANHRQFPAVDIDGPADSVRVRVVSTLPQSMADHHGRRARNVIVAGEYPS